MKRFELTIIERDLIDMRRMLIDSDVPGVPDMTDEEVISTAAFYMSFGRYGELDLRDRVRIKKLLEK